MMLILLLQGVDAISAAMRADDEGVPPRISATSQFAGYNGNVMDAQKSIMTLTKTESATNYSSSAEYEINSPDTSSSKKSSSQSFDDASVFSQDEPRREQRRRKNADGKQYRNSYSSSASQEKKKVSQHSYSNNFVREEDVSYADRDQPLVDFERTGHSQKSPVGHGFTKKSDRSMSQTSGDDDDSKCKAVRCTNGGRCILDAVERVAKCRCPLGTTGKYCEKG